MSRLQFDYIFLERQDIQLAMLLLLLPTGFRIIYINLQGYLFHSITELKLILRTLNIYINRIYKIIGYYIMECGVGIGN